MKHLVLSCSEPAGQAFLKESVLVEPPHLRMDKTRPGDIYALGNGLHRRDSVMDIVITSAMQRSCLLNSSKSSDFAIRKAENEKFRKDARSAGPIQNCPTKRFIPLAMNHFGLRGGHFNAALKEFATLLVLRISGCSLMKGPFALSMNGALRKIMESWGSRLTWTVQRQHAARLISGMEAFHHSSASFLGSYGRTSLSDEPDH
jgi:hypothetical protein